ncbi:MAG: GtrA family protein [Dehalococcoidia bacterium]
METSAAAPSPLSPVIDRFAARLHLSPAFIKFLMVGAIAYFINQIALLLLYDVLPVLPAKDQALDFGLFTHPDIRLLLASVIAVETAIVFKFYALENWTFRDRPRRGWGPVRFLQFNASCALGPVITVTTVNILTPVFGISPYISNTAGTLVGVVVNWAFSAYLIWPHAKAQGTGVV